MALSATIALSVASVAVSSVPREQKVRATVTVSNSDATDIILKEIVPSIVHTGQAYGDQMVSAALGKCQIDANNPVPAMDSAIYVFDLSPHAASITGTYDVSCLVYGNGEIVEPVPATLAVTES